MNLANPLPFFLPSRACTQRGGGRAIDNRKIARASPPNRISRWPPVLFAYRFQRFVGNNDGPSTVLHRRDCEGEEERSKMNVEHGEIKQSVCCARGRD